MPILYLRGLSDNLITTSGATFSSSSQNALFPRTNLGTGKPYRMFRFNTAASGDQVTIDLGSSLSASFVSIHGHNIDSGVTSIQLRKSTDNFSANDVLVATLPTPTIDPSSYITFTSTSSRYWRLLFNGTNGSAIWLGEWVLGAHRTKAVDQLYGWKVKKTMPQQRSTSYGGQVLANNLASFPARSLNMSFASPGQASRTEPEEMFFYADWGVEPIVVVPDSEDTIVIHGRLDNSWEYSNDEAQDPLYRYSISVLEDPFPVITK